MRRYIRGDERVIPDEVIPAAIVVDSPPQRNVVTGEKKPISAQRTNALVPPSDPLFPDRLLFMAMEDLDSSIILFHRGHYPQAVFLLQQSTEKASKSLGILFQVITEKEAARFVRHNPLNIVRKTTEDFAKSIRYINDHQQEEAEFHTLFAAGGMSYAEVVENVETSEKQAIEYLKSLDEYDLTEIEISAIIAEMEEFESNINKGMRKLDEEGIVESEYEEMKQRLEEMYVSYVQSLTLPEEKKEELLMKLPQVIPEILPENNLLEYILNVVLMVIGCSAVLFQLARITAPHAVLARYPDSQKEFDPIEFYTSDRPLIASMPTLFIHARTTLEWIDQLYDIIADGGV